MSAESRIAQLASSPLLRNYAFDRSQGAIRPEQKFLSPLCEVPTLNFRYKQFNAENRFKLANTKRDVGGKATQVGFSATDQSLTLEPNALDFRIPNVEGLSDEDLQFSLMHGTNILADSAGLSLTSETLSLAVAATTGSQFNIGWGVSASGTSTYDPIGDPTNGLDLAIFNVLKAVAGTCPVKVLFGATAFRKFRSNSFIRSRFIVGSERAKTAAGVGLQSPNIGDVGNLLFGNPQCLLATTVYDTAAQGITESLAYAFDDKALVFAASDAPNTFDPSFMKTFATMGGFFKPGAYRSVDERDQFLKMDWTTLPYVTNTLAGQLINTSPTS
jgi:hypothetical protein